MTEIISKKNTMSPNSEAKKTDTSHSPPPQTYLFTGGGTGGHVYPGLAIADEVRHREPGARIIYIGARGKIEAKLVPERGYPILLVHAQGLPTKKNPWLLFAFAFQTGLGILQCLFHLLRIRPDVIVATGGYASSPLLLALAILRTFRLSSTYCFVHEQNVVPGLVNRLAGRIADRIGTSFPESSRYFPKEKTVQVGYPVRREIGTVTRETARTELNIPNNAFVVFAFGASTGARSINRALVGTLPQLLAHNNLQVIHIIGQQASDEYNAEKDTADRLAATGLDADTLSRYHQLSYSHNIEVLYAASDIVVGRAAAGTVTEICACSCPSILIPLPNAPGDHQAMNGKTLEVAEAAYVLYESTTIEHNKSIGTIDAQKLSDLILTLYNDTKKRNHMTEQAQSLFDRHGLDRILSQIYQDKGHSNAELFKNLYIERGSDVDSSFEAIDMIAHMSPFRLLRELEQKRQITIKKAGPDYLKYKVDLYLANPRWQIRNVGIKIVGLLDYKDKLPRLLMMLQNRTPVSRLQRLFGGDFQQVGFIRRNIIRTLIQLEVYDMDVRSALLLALGDPYFEVRSTAARAISALSSSIGDDDEMTQGLRHLLQDKSFEVITAGIKALGKIGDATVQEDFRPFYLVTNWKIREAVIQALIFQIQRGHITDYEALANDTENILATSVDFEPTFPIRRSLNELIELINERRQKEPPCSTT